MNHASFGRVCGAAFWIAVALPGVSFGGTQADCFLHRNEAGAPLIHLDAAAIDSIGTLISDRNIALFDKIDAAFHEGKYGDPTSSRARADALSAFIYRAETAFDFATSLAFQREAIYETSEEDLREAFSTGFRNPGFYPIVNLKSARTGSGRYCLMFDTELPPREITVAGDLMKAWSEDTDLGTGQKARVLNIEMRTFSYDKVHIIYEPHSEGAMTTFEIEAGGAPVTVLSMEGIEGQFVRKYGFHAVNAIAMWKTNVAELEAPPAKGTFLGAAIYFPELKVETPWFVPDLGFDDLRLFETPEPLLTMKAAQELQTRKLDWVRIKKNLRFAKWEGDGGIPEALKKRYPDK